MLAQTYINTPPPADMHLYNEPSHVFLLPVQLSQLLKWGCFQVQTGLRHVLWTKTLHAGLLGHISVSKPFITTEPNPMLQGKWLCIKWPAQSSQPQCIILPPAAPPLCCLRKKCGPKFSMPNQTVKNLAHLYPELCFVLFNHSEIFSQKSVISAQKST